MFKFITLQSQLLCSLLTRWTGITQVRSYVKIRLLCPITVQKSARLVNASKNNFQTGQNSHLAVEPAAPAVLCWNMLIISNMVLFFSLTKTFFLHYLVVLVSTIGINSTNRGPQNLVLNQYFKNCCCAFFRLVPIKHTVWVIFWYYFAWAHCDRFSWEQQFTENSQWLRHDFSLHPWQLFYLLDRLLTALSVHFSSKQSDPGSDRSSIRGSAVQTPSPTSWQTSAKAANRSSGCRTTSPSCAAQAETLPGETRHHRDPSSPSLSATFAAQSNTIHYCGSRATLKVQTDRKEEPCDSDKAESIAAKIWPYLRSFSRTHI